MLAWGVNTYGEVGNGTRSPQTRPAPVQLPSAAVAVAAGAGFSLALLDDGRIYAWGRNDLGQLGDGSGTDQSTPVLITGLAGVTSIAASANHAAAVSGGNVYVWGGDFVLPPNQSARPVQAPVLANVVAVFAGGDNTFALKGDGTLWGFGNPTDGRLGDSGISDGKTPAAVKAASGALLSDIEAVAVGDNVSMALLRDGSLVGWGKNDRGQLGLGHMSVVTAATKLSPGIDAPIANASAGASNLLVDTKGRMFAAGSNERGSLALGDTLETRAQWNVPGLAAVTAVAATPTESLALRADGVVLSWGAVDASTALSSVAAPRAVPGLAGRFIAIAGGRQTAVAVRDDGAVYGWGASVPGSSVTPIVSPIAIAGLTNAKAAASGGLGVIALTNTGRALIACGKPGCPGADFGFGDVVAVAAGETHFLVLRADKSVWAWGANDKGQLGTGGTAPATAPVRVSNLANVRSIAAGADFSVAVREDGQAFTWGLAPSFAAFKASPTRVSGLDGAAILVAQSHVLSLDQQNRGRTWGRGSKVGERDHLFPGREPRMDGMKALAAGVNHSLGVTANGTVVAWGRNFQQQLAVPRTQAVSTFVEVSDQANGAYTRGTSPVVEFLNPAITMGGQTNLTHFFMAIVPGRGRRPRHRDHGQGLAAHRPQLARMADRRQGRTCRRRTGDREARVPVLLVALEQPLLHRQRGRAGRPHREEPDTGRCDRLEARVDRFLCGHAGVELSVAQRAATLAVPVQGHADARRHGLPRRLLPRVPSVRHRADCRRGRIRTTSSLRAGSTSIATCATTATCTKASRSARRSRRSRAATCRRTTPIRGTRSRPGRRCKASSGSPMQVPATPTRRFWWPRCRPMQATGPRRAARTTVRPVLRT